jgi:membrane fusion protein (multidrug efflux system)
MNEATPATPNPQRRTRLFIGLGLVVVLAALGYGVYWFIYERHVQTTDDAYVNANIVQVTAQVAGTVTSIAVNETDAVHAGQTLIQLDATNSQVALGAAEAELAQAVREAGTVYADNSSLASTVSQRRAQLAQSHSALANAQRDLQRRAGLAASGAVSQEEVQHAKTAWQAAQSEVSAAQAAEAEAQSRLRANQHLTAHTDVRRYPKVEAAAIKVRQAWLDLKRGAILAPIDGYVGKRSVQLGQRIAVGVPLLTVVPLRQAWVDANFKEAQLRDMRIGQPVTLISDAYGKHVEYRGRVVGMGAGTGAAFALLPAQNATGNWIKVVQRIPVRIGLDPNALATHPLRVGMSMEVSVDVADTRGSTLAASTSAMAATTTVYARDDRRVDALIAQIIDANLSAAAPTAHAP